MSLLLTTDFTGKHLVVTDGVLTTAFQEIIDDACKRYLKAFLGDDLYGVAFYNTKTKHFNIDDDEISDSISAYREDNQ